MALRTRDGVNPIYVSIGHKVDLPSAVRWVLACCAGYRMPEPTRLAHLAAAGRLPEMEPSMMERAIANQPSLLQPTADKGRTDKDTMQELNTQAERLNNRISDLMVRL